MSPTQPHDSERRQAAVEKELISYCADGGNIGQVLVGRIPGCCKQIAGRGRGNVQIALKTEQLRVQVVHHGISGWVGFVVVQDQGEVFPACSGPRSRVRSVLQNR